MVEEWATADTFDATRLNKKTRFIGTGLQAKTFLTDPQVGQMVYPTLNDSTSMGDYTLQDDFRHDKFSFYTSAGWKHHTPTETQYSTGIAVSTQACQINVTNKQYIFHTLPSTDKFYRITAIEVGHDDTSGDVTCGVDLINANPPTNDNTPLVALFPKTTMGGAFGGSTIITTSMSNVLAPSSIIGYWAFADTTSSGYGAISGSSTGYYKSVSGATTPSYADGHSFATSSGNGCTLALKLYYIGYS